MEKTPSHRDLLNTEEAAAILGIKPQTLAVWLSTKRYPIRSLKVGRLRKFRRKDIEAFIDQCECAYDNVKPLEVRKSRRQTPSTSELGRVQKGGTKDGV